MGLDNMRSGNSRCTNLSIALAAVCFLLTYNWWYLSTQNSVLLKQLDDISDQLKMCSEEKSSCEVKRNSVEQQLRETETRVADMKIVEIKSADFIKKLKTDLEEQTKMVEKNDKEVGYCKTELNSLKNVDDSKTTMLESMRMEKEALDAKLQESQDKIKELELTIKNAKLTTSSLKAVTPSGGSLMKPKVLNEEESQFNNGPVKDGNHAIENDGREMVDDTIDSPK